jgi:hypothetical protein
MPFEQHLKSAAWTGAEVGAVIAGGIAATKFLDHTKVFKEDFAANPGWFIDGREGAKFMIKHWGAIKAGGALLASTYVTNPWLKLFLMGVAVQGGLEELRMLTWDKNKQVYRFDQLGAGDVKQLDTELKALADQYRTTQGGPDSGVSKPEYDSSVAKPEYDSSVARSYEDDFDGGMPVRRPFRLDSSDYSAAA